jgi:hypothetical protein
VNRPTFFQEKTQGRNRIAQSFASPASGGKKSAEKEETAEAML